MGKLEERFFSKSGETLVETWDSCADELYNILKAGIIKGESLEWWKSGWYTYDFDRIYDRKL